MKKVIKEPFLKRSYTRRKKREPRLKKIEPTEEKEESLHEPSIAPDEVMEPRDKTQEDQDQGSEEDEEFWKEVAQTEEEYEREEAERLKKIEQRKRLLLDDVPFSLKRKEAPREEGEASEEETKRLKPTHFTYVKNVVMEDDIAARLAEKAGRKVEGAKRASEWMSRGEVRQLASLLDMPVCAVRIHKQARKKM